MKEILRNRTVRAALGGIVALAGIGGIMHSSVSDYDPATHSSPKIERRVEQLVPGYNPQAFQKAEQVVDVFKQQQDLTAKTIEVPENVTQAAVFIRDGKKTYYDGSKLYKKMEKNKLRKNFGIFIGSLFVGIPGIVVLAVNLSPKPRERITQREKSNSAQTQS